MLSCHGDLMPEIDALKALASLGVTWQGLRKYAGEKQASRRMGDSVSYLRAFVEDLATNFVTKQQVMRSLEFGVSRFYYWAKSRGIEPIQIGKVCLWSRRSRWCWNSDGMDLIVKGLLKRAGRKIAGNTGLDRFCRRSVHVSPAR